MLSCGTVGLPGSGKTTVFRLLTNVAPSGSGSASAFIPDTRLEALSALYQPKKTTLARIQLTDAAGLNPGSGKTTTFLDAIRPSDVLLHVIRCFGGNQPHVLGGTDPVRDFNLINDELLLADMGLLEKRLNRIHSTDKIKLPQREQIPVLKKCLEHLAEGSPMRALELSADEQDKLQGLVFFSHKPQLVVANLDEQNLAAPPDWLQGLEQKVALNGWQTLCLSAAIEEELAFLDEEDRPDFMEDLGIEQPAISLLARQLFRLQGLITFFTVVNNEVRAWPLTRGSTALDAAGTIHSDLARGFIRADVYKTADLLELGSENVVKDSGLALLVGKDYVVEDGDVIHIRFNV
jgi:GTP-binding protein YchF